MHEFAQDSRYYYLVTEYCEGGELLDKIIGLKSFSEQLAAKVMKQLLSAVAYCHLKHIVHRDLKPENLVFETNDIQSNIKVIDFGTSKIFKAKEKMKEVMGTVFFLLLKHFCRHIILLQKLLKGYIQKNVICGAVESFFLLCFVEAPLLQENQMKKF